MTGCNGTKPPGAARLSFKNQATRKATIQRARQKPRLSWSILALLASRKSLATQRETILDPALLHSPKNSASRSLVPERSLDLGYRLKGILCVDVGADTVGVVLIDHGTSNHGEDLDPGFPELVQGNIHLLQGGGHEG